MGISRRNGGFRRALLSAFLAAAGACTIARSGAPPQSKFSISTSSFQPDGDIPARFTCSGDNLSPALAWTEPPSGTQSLALIVDDPDAPGGVFTHWVLYDLAAGARRLPEGIQMKADPEGGRQGSNGFGETGYGGPCPPPGHVHRYYFRLYALDSKFGLPPGASKSALEKAMKGHVLAQAEVMGKFKR